MIKQAFLTREEIKALQAQEAASTKEQKRTPEQIDAIYSSGTNILVSASAGSGKTFVMVQRILDQMQRGISIKELFISPLRSRQQESSRSVWKVNLGKPCKRVMIQSSSNTWPVKSQMSPPAISKPWTLYPKVLTRLWLFAWVGTSVSTFLQNASEQRLLQNEVFQTVFDRYYQGENQEAFVQMVKNFTGQRKNLTLFKEQVYQIYDFFSRPVIRRNGWRKHFLKGYEETDFRTGGRRSDGEHPAGPL